MRHYPDPADPRDMEKLARLRVEPWMVEALKLNPEYVHWGPREDYMVRGDSEDSWDSPLFFNSYDDMFDLDESNEVVHFYYHLEREDQKCVCEGSGLNPASQALSDAFHAGPSRWADKITQAEFEMLQAHGRCTRAESVEEVNAANALGRAVRKIGLSHDAINAHLLVKFRGTAMGIYGHCPECSGTGQQFIAEKGQLKLTLWVLYPRKGASRGVEISNLTPEQFERSKAMLREAAARSVKRFSAVDS